MENMFYEEEQHDEESIDISRYIKVVIKRKWLILAIFLAITIPWFLYLKSLPPTYEAFCDIEFRSLEGGDNDVINESQITKLRSRTFAEKVVGQLGLTLLIDPKETGIHRTQLFEEFTSTLKPLAGEYTFTWNDDGNYSILRKDEKNDTEDVIHEGSVIGASLALQETDANFKFKLAEDMSLIPREVTFYISDFKNTVESFRENTYVGFEGPNILRLSMTDNDPYLVAKMVNRLAEIYVDESKNLRKNSFLEYRTIVEEKLKRAEELLEESQLKLEEFRKKNVVSLSAETNKRAGDLNEAEDNLKVQLQHKQDLDELLSKIESEGETKEEKEHLKYIYQQLAQLPTFETNYKMGILRSQLADKETEYGTITGGVLTEKHKKAIEMDNEITKLQEEIRKEALAHRQNLSGKISKLQNTISDLKYKLSTKLPEDELQLMVLEREYRTNEEIYRNLKSQSQLADISGTVDNASVDILDKAIPPEYPVNRTKKQKAVMGAGFALFLGFGVAFAIEFLDKSIKTVEDVRKYLKLNVLGTIPNLEFKDVGDYQDSEKMRMIDQQLVTYDYSPTPIGEAYRSLRTNLVFSKTAGRIQTFVLTSTEPGDGKSFTAANLAISIAQHKSNTLLIDADLRRGVLHNTFGVPKEPGFSNYLTNTATLTQIINETLIPNLSLVSCGSLLPNPSELLGSHQMKRFIDEAKRKFDIILFDSPPLNAATDAIVIGTQVDTTVIVIRSGITNRNTARQKLELFKNVPAKVLGVILNGTTAEFGHDGYSYYHY